jgi:hypothetical protein
MPNLNVEDLRLILIFIVPGLIILYVRSRFITGRPQSHAENLLSYLVLSTVYYAITTPFLQASLSIRHPWILWALIWILLTIVGPAILGLLLGAEAQKEWLTKIAARLHLSVVHVIPTAWDWRFSKISSGTFLLVTLTSDERVAGYFGSVSFASSDTAERDLYIEEEYDIDSEGSWTSRSEKVGVFIPFKEIKYVEFWEPELIGASNVERQPSATA